MAGFLKSRLAWWLVFLGGLLPFSLLIYYVFTNDLGVEPGVTVLEYLGTSAIVFLMVTLSLTPLKRWMGFSQLIRYRRMLGLYCLFYAFLHVISFGLFIVEWVDFFGSLYKRPYVVMGALAFVILLALGVTSPKVMVRRLGRRWKALHRSVYLAALLVVVHVWWQVRSDYAEALSYLLVFAVLMLLRLRLRREIAQ